MPSPYKKPSLSNRLFIVYIVLKRFTRNQEWHVSSGTVISKAQQHKWQITTNINSDKPILKLTWKAHLLLRGHSERRKKKHNMVTIVYAITYNYDILLLKNNVLDYILPFLFLKLIAVYINLNYFKNTHTKVFKQ